MYFIKAEHSHIAPHAVALFSHAQQVIQHKAPRFGVKIVQLGGIRPRGKIRVTPVGNMHPGFIGKKLIRVNVRLGGSGVDVQIRVCVHRGRIYGGVVAYKIQKYRNPYTV